MKKRLISLLLAVVMVVAMIPMATLPASATETAADSVILLEYIESRGESALDTGIYASSATKWVLDAQFTNTAGLSYNGAYQSSGLQRFDIAVDSGFRTNYGPGNSVMNHNTSRHTFVIDATEGTNGKWHIDSQSGTYSTKYDTPMDVSVALFARHYLDGYRYLAFEKVYSSQFYENGSLILDLRPCVAVESIPASLVSTGEAVAAGQLGMLDTVSGKFYPIQDDVSDYERRNSTTRGCALAGPITGDYPVTDLHVSGAVTATCYSSSGFADARIVGTVVGTKNGKTVEIPGAWCFDDCTGSPVLSQSYAATFTPAIPGISTVSDTATVVSITDELPLSVVEYIESKGSDVLYTGVYGSKDITWVLDAAFTKASGTLYNGTYDQATDAGRFDIAIDGTSFKMNFGASNSVATADTDRHIFTLDAYRNAWSFDSLSGTFANAFSVSTRLDLALFARTCIENSSENSSWTEFYAYEIVYSTQFYDCGVLIRDFRPCVAVGTIPAAYSSTNEAVASGTLGMLDLVSNVFYPLQYKGSGSRSVAGPAYNVVFDMNGHGDAIASISGLAVGSTVPEPTAPTDVLFTFEGWYKDKECTVAWDFENDTTESDAVILHAKWSPKFNFGATSLSLKDNTWLNLYTDITDEEISELEFTYAIADGDAVTVNSSMISKTESGWRVSVALKPYQLADDVTVTIYSKTDIYHLVPLDIATDSVRDYCGRAFTALEGTVDQNMINLKGALSAMLEYGAAVQIWQNYNTTDLANSILD